MTRRVQLATMQALSAVLVAVSISGSAAPAVQQRPPDASPLRTKIDAVVEDAYRRAAAGFPCQPKTRGKPKMLRWEDVDRCLNEAERRIDWTAVSTELAKARAEQSRMTAGELLALIDESLAAHALTFDKVLTVKDGNTLLPLTNSLLKFLPPDSLQDTPVFNKAGAQVGMFFGTYGFERTGGLSTANTIQLTIFQYTDPNGNIQSPPDRLLLDSFGVPWSKAEGQRGFRLTTSKLTFERDTR